jgi:hypothetical protein
VEPLAPQHILEVHKAVTGPEAMTTHEQIKAKFRENFGAGGTRTPTKPVVASIFGKNSASKSTSGKQQPSSSHKAASTNKNQRSSSPSSQLPVDSERLLDIFSPYKGRSNISGLTAASETAGSTSAAAVDNSFRAFDESLQQHQSFSSTRPEAAYSSAVGVQSAASRSSYSAVGNSKAAQASGSGSGIAVPQADQSLLSKFAAKINTRHLHGHAKGGQQASTGTGGSFSIVPRSDNIVIPLLGIGVDTAMRGKLVVNSVDKKNDSSSPNVIDSSANRQSIFRRKQSLGGAGAGSRASIADVNFSQSLTPFTQSTAGSPNALLKGPKGSGSPMPEGSAVSPLHQAVASGIIDPAPGQPINTATSSTTPPASGRRSSMPGLRNKGSTSTALDVKKILAGIGNKASPAGTTSTLANNAKINASLGSSKAAKEKDPTEDDEDISRQVEALKLEMIQRQALQRQSAHHAGGSSPTTRNTGRSPDKSKLSPIMTKSGAGNVSTKTKSRNMSGTSATSEDDSTTNASTNASVIDMATVRDISTMIQSIKKETITTMAGAWKR